MTGLLGMLSSACIAAICFLNESIIVCCFFTVSSSSSSASTVFSLKTCSSVFMFIISIKEWGESPNMDSLRKLNGASLPA
jgi:hypothetical protein